MRFFLAAVLPLCASSFSLGKRLAVPRVVTRAALSEQDEMYKSDLMAAVGGGTSVTASKRVVVNEILLKLEASNPTEAPATSPLVNGEWELAYSGGFADGILKSPTRQIALFLYAGGYAPANFGLALGRLLPDSLFEITRTKLAIARTQPRVSSMAEVKIAGAAAPTELGIASTLEIESNVRLKETYVSLNVGGNKIDVPEAAQYSRLLFVVYLDEDLMVIRDETGVPEVLIRKEMDFPETSGGGSFMPSSADDDLSPGAG